jgi:hypothetical protein
MSEAHLYGTDDLLRYAFDELEAEERARLDEHLVECTDCKDFISFVKTFNRGIREAVSAFPAPGEACPDSFLIAALESDALDAATAAQVRSHVLFCKTCLDDFLAFRRLTRDHARETIPALWVETLERFKQYLIDLGATYGVGTLFGPAMILEEGPALAVRGETGSALCSKAIEINVGQNSYSVEVSVNEDGQLAIDVAGSRIRQNAPLAVVLRAETGEELAATETDRFGNGQLSIPASEIEDGLCVLCAALGEDQAYLPLRIPAGAQLP